MDQPRERIRFEARQHGIVLARPLAFSLAAGGGAVPVVASGWPLVTGGVVLLVAAAAVALRAVWRWERTRIVVSDERLVVAHGTLRRRLATVPLARVGAVEVDQPLLGRMLGYGTLVAGDLEVPYVPSPRDVVRLVG